MPLYKYTCRLSIFTVRCYASAVYAIVVRLCDKCNESDGSQYRGALRYLVIAEVQKSTVGINDICRFIFIDCDVLVADSSGVLYFLQTPMTHPHQFNGQF